MRPSTGARLALVGLLVLVAAALGGDRQGAPDRRGEDGAVRVMLVGDSVTQGVEGDWTWRYRLWKHLEQSGAEVDFVGPRDDVYDIDDGAPTHWYVDPDFDQDHAAQRGVRFEGLDPSIGSLVEDFAPDVVVVMLGVNDLVWPDAPADAEVIEERMRDFVAQARAADPGLALVVSTIPQGYFEVAAEYDAALPAAVAALSTPESPVVVAHADDGFEAETDTWDGVHATAPGELKIAAAVADALAVLGVGRPARRPLPVVEPGPRFAPPLAAEAGDGSVRLSWLDPPGVLEEVVELRDVTAGEAWAAWGEPVEGDSLTVDGLVNGHTYEVRLRPKRGYWAAPADVRSPTRVFVPGP